MATKLHSFSVKALKNNLETGRGLNQKIPLVSRIGIVFADDSSRGPLNSFYVNELPRLAVANPQIKFNISHGLACELKILVSDKEHQISIQNKTPSEIYSSLLSFSSDVN